LIQTSFGKHIGVLAGLAVLLGIYLAIKYASDNNWGPQQKHGQSDSFSREQSQLGHYQPYYLQMKDPLQQILCFLIQQRVLVFFHYTSKKKTPKKKPDFKNTCKLGTQPSSTSSTTTGNVGRFS
jgi:hypothetical protein